MRQFLRITPYAFLMVLFASITPVLIAQNNCPALVQQALNAIGSNCSNMTRNTACYGYNLVGATFLNEVPEDFFTSPADRAEVNQLETVSTAPLNVEDNRWGVAVMSLQANIPNTLPGQAVTFVLLGDVEVENAVDPDQTFTPADPVDVRANANANVRSGPGLTFNVIGAVASGQTLQTDAQSNDGAWLRVAYNDVIGWIFRDLVTSDVDLTALPTISDQARLPMQAFYLRTGIGQPACEEATADSLIIQGPERITVNFTVNGADVSLGSTAVIRILEGDRMEISVLDGKAVVDGVEVPQGYKTSVCLSPPEDHGLDGEANDQLASCPPSAPEQLTTSEQESWCSLGDVPASLLNYNIPIRCGQGILFPTATPTSVPARPIATATRAADDCAALRPTSPLTDAPSSPTTFYWDGVAAAASYVVVISDGAGNVIQRVSSAGASTNVGVSGLPQGGQIRWLVEAYVGDGLLCTSPSTGLIAVLGPQTVPTATASPTATPPPFVVTWQSCDFDGEEATFTFEVFNININDTVEVSYMSTFEEFVTAFVQGPGIHTLTLFGEPANTVTFRRLSNDETVVITPPPCILV